MSLKKTAAYLMAFTAAATLAVAPSEAQVWQAVGTPQNGSWQTGTRAFWNNSSDDNTNVNRNVGCNIGFVVLGLAQDPDCNSVNTRPTNWLPFTGSAPSVFLSGNGTGAQAFVFGAGRYRISQIASLGGDIAGLDRPWGFFSTSGGSTTVPPSASGAPYNSGLLTFNSSWGLFIDLAIPTGAGVVNSNNIAFARHFSLFGYGTNPANLQDLGGGVTQVNASGVQSYIVGLEDNSCTALSPVGTPNAQRCTRISDYDNNDVIFMVQSVPEPSTYVLMAGGILGLVGMSYRRRRSV